MWSSGIQDGSVIVVDGINYAIKGTKLLWYINRIIYTPKMVYFTVFVELNAKIDNTLSGLVWFYCFQTFKFFGFSIFWWWLFQKRVVRTKFDIHVFVRSHWHDNHTKHCFPTLSIIPFSYGKGPLDTIVLPTRHIVCERLLSNAKSAIFQIYYGENKLIFNEMMRSTNTLY